MKNKKIKINFYKLIALLLVIVAIAIIAYTIPNHISEINAIEECNKDPQCNWCTGFEWTMGRATLNYSFSVIALVIATSLLLKNKQKKLFVKEKGE